MNFTEHGPLGMRPSAEKSLPKLKLDQPELFDERYVQPS
jgi:hypothetical protein